MWWYAGGMTALLALIAAIVGVAGVVGVVGVAGHAGSAAGEAARRRRRDRRGTRTLAPGAVPAVGGRVWARRLSFPAFMATACHNRRTFEEVYREPAYREADLEWLRTLPPLRVVAIAEDWCPDVSHTLPTWARLVEELPGWELGIFARDTVPEVMEAFAWQGDRRRLPVYAFYLGDRLQVWWSGRCAQAEKALAGILAGRAFADLPEDERRRGCRLLQEGYRREFRRQSLDEVLALLHAFFHSAP
jgi:hypothetical protein